MADFKHATPKIIETELSEFRDWCVANEITRRYDTNLRQLDKLSTELGYEVNTDKEVKGSILSIIIGRVRDKDGKKKKNLKVAVGLIFLIRNKLETYRSDKASGQGSLTDVKTALNNYARFLLNIGREQKIDKTIEDKLTKLRDARKLAGNISLFFKKNELRNSLKSRLTTENRGLLNIRKINKLLSGYSNYNKFIDKLIDSIIFYVYDFINDPDYKHQIPLTIKDIQKLHFEKEGLCFVVDNDGHIYRLLTPTYPGKPRPAIGYTSEDFHIDHEPAISVRLKNIADSIPNIVAINDMMESDCSKKLDSEKKDLIVKELELIHKGLELRMMEEAENLKKSDN